VKRFLSRLFLNDYVYCSIFVAILLSLISFIPVNHELIDPFKEALEDFEVTDLGFTKLRADDPPADTNIVIINTGKMERAELAAAIRNLNQYKPAVIGFNDVLYRSEDTFGDSLLAEALKEVDNIVYTSKLYDYSDSTAQWSALEVPDSLFMKFVDSMGVKYAETGFKNMPTNDKDFKTTRHFFEKATVTGIQENFFAVELIEVVSPEKVERFMKRANDHEVINYRGNIDKFTTLDAEQVLNNEFDPSLIKGKILILGYLGASLSDEKFWDDYKYYTPLNKEYAGKTFPDMFETVIYANIASQILADKHIHVVDFKTNLMINLVICFLNVVLFSLLFQAAAVWWDAFSIIITLLETVVLLLATAFVFSYYRIEVNVNTSIVFIIVLSSFLELYYGLFKIAIQKYTVKYRIQREDESCKILWVERLKVF
jgi:CHASE2 domain-containing sensor protein